MSKQNLFKDSNHDTIADGLVGAFHYKLTLDDGEVVDESFSEEPLPYLHGAENIVPGLEKEMTGKKIGDKFKVTVPPEQGYGEKSGAEPLAIPRGEFPEEMPFEEGMPIHAELEGGEFIVFHVVEVLDDEIMVTIDHPLAGETLHFEIEVMGVREATEEELEHGHPHGLHGDEAHDDDWEDED